MCLPSSVVVGLLHKVGRGTGYSPGQVAAQSKQSTPLVLTGYREGTKNGPHQVHHQHVRIILQAFHQPGLCSQEKVPVSSYLSRSCFKISKWVSITYDLGNFHTAAFHWISGQMGLCASPLRARSPLFYISVVLLDLIPIDFQNRCFRGSLF